MEKLIFFGLVIPILFFVLYLGTRAIMSGVSAKQANQTNKEDSEIDNNIEELNTDESLSEELEKLKDLLVLGSSMLSSISFSSLLAWLACFALTPLMIALVPKYKTKNKIGITSPKKINFSII